MRMMLRAVMDTPTGNAAIRDGSMGEAVGRLMEMLHPEAAYFAPEDGKRACFMVFDMDDPADLPVISEPLFSDMQARVTIVPCMNVEDLQKGLARLQAAAGNQAGKGVPTSAGAGIG
jgi:hypothetical protein